MKINDQPMQKKLRKVALPQSNGENLVLTVKSTPFGLYSKFSQIWPHAVPPKKAIHTPGKGTVQEEIINDPTYVEEATAREAGWVAYELFHMLAEDKSVSWENNTDTIDGIRGLVREMEESELTNGDVIIIQQASKSVANVGLSLEEIEELFV